MEREEKQEKLYSYVCDYLNDNMFDDADDMDKYDRDEFIREIFSIVKE